MKKTLSSLVLFLFILSCATPEVVNVIGPNDNKLSCQELSNEIARANKLAKRSEAKRSKARQGNARQGEPEQKDAKQSAAEPTSWKARQSYAN